MTLATLSFGQIKTENDSIASPHYDSELAEELGADDYGMKNFFLVILSTGSNQTTDKELINKSFRGHMDNINRLVEEKKLILAGPLAANEHGYRGIFILDNVNAIEDAEALLKTDLAIKNNLLDYEIFTWYGSAALPTYLPFAEKITKIKP